jgi:starch synthase
VTRRVVTMALSRQGGLNQCTHALNVGLVNDGWELLHITSRGYELAHLPKPYEVRQVFDMARTRPGAVAGLLWDLRRWRPAAIQLNGAEHPTRYLALFALLRLAVRAPLIYGAHNVSPQWTEETAPVRRTQRLILRALGNLSDRVVVSAHENKRRFVDLTGLPFAKVSVIPIGNNVPLRNPAEGVGAWDPDPAEPPPATGTNILFFGNIVPTKGLKYLLQALPAVLREQPAARLRIVGRPVEPFDAYAAMSSELGLGDHVDAQLSFVPFDEILGHFRWADLLVLPYVQTSQSGVLFTASAVARPSVVTDVGGLPEAVEHERSGLIVPPRDPEALAVAVCRLLGDADLRAAMGRRAQELCNTTFSWRTIAREAGKLFEALGRGDNGRTGRRFRDPPPIDSAGSELN